MLTWIVIIILFHYLLDLFLVALNIRAMKPILPPEVSSVYDDEAYARSQRYARDHALLDLVASAISTLVTLLLFITGSFGWLDSWIRGFTVHPIAMTLVFFAILGFIADLAGVPVQLYGSFVIEKRYGFNRLTPGTFILDKLKSWMLAMFLGGPLLTLVVWFYMLTGSGFWWIAWILVTLFSLIITFFYSSLIVPLFNRQTPLEEGSLRRSISAFADRVGFRVGNIYMINGSKRSTKANAYFTGFGRKRRIVLYDTLVDDLEEKEVVAVLAHETGHYKLNHIWTGLAASVLQTGLMLFLFSLLIDSDVLARSVGATLPSFHIGALVFAVLYSPVSLLTGILMNLLSRKNEFSADAFAARWGAGEALASGLKRLSVKNLSNLTPHPVYAFMHYSHPPLLTRLRRLQDEINESRR